MSLIKIGGTVGKFWVAYFFGFLGSLNALALSWQNLETFGSSDVYQSQATRIKVADNGSIYVTGYFKTISTEETFAQLRRSRDQGATWQTIYSGTSQYNCNLFHNVFFGKAGEVYFYYGCTDGTNHEWEITKSLDYGDHWTRVIKSSEPSPTSVKLADDGTFWITGIVGNYYSASSERVFVRKLSPDGILSPAIDLGEGESWSLGLPNSHFVYVGGMGPRQNGSSKSWVVWEINTQNSKVVKIDDIPKKLFDGGPSDIQADDQGNLLVSGMLNNGWALRFTADRGLHWATVAKFGIKDCIFMGGRDLVAKDGKLWTSILFLDGQPADHIRSHLVSFDPATFQTESFPIKEFEDFKSLAFDSSSHLLGVGSNNNPDGSFSWITLRSIESLNGPTKK